MWSLNTCKGSGKVPPTPDGSACGSVLGCSERLSSVAWREGGCAASNENNLYFAVIQHFPLLVAEISLKISGPTEAPIAYATEETLIFFKHFLAIMMVID